MNSSRIVTLTLPCLLREPATMLLEVRWDSETSENRAIGGAVAHAGNAPKAPLEILRNNHT